MTTVAEFFAEGLEERDKVKRDRWGRYLLPHPETGKEQAWTRVTTLVKACSETYNLERWAKRMVARGVAAREDFAIAVLAATDDQELDRVVELAKEHAGGSIGSRHGTAMHALSERVDRGETISVPPGVNRDLDAYREAMAALRVEAIERIVVLPAIETAGTLDRLVRLPDGRLVVLDLKTGADLGYAWVEIAAQLHLYASAPWLWNPETGSYDPMPDEVSKTEALVLHLPKGQGTAQLYTVDIGRADEIVYLCTEVRRIRKLNGLARPITAAELSAAAPVATPQPEPQETAAPASTVVGLHYPLNPAPDSGFLAPDEDINALATLIGQTPPDVLARVKAWATEATAAERPFDLTPMTRRTWTVMRAALLCALHCLDWQVRLGLSRVLGGDIPEGWHIGATLASLDEAQADQLATLALSSDLDPF